MAKNTKILNNIAFKKLSNATLTNPGFSEFQESIATNIQLGTNTIFGQTPPASPPEPLYAIDGNSIVQKVKLDLIPLSDGVYNASSYAGDNSDYDDVDAGSTSTSHSFAMALPSNYQTIGTNNPKAGTGYFVNGTQLSDTSGKVQLVPLSYGVAYKPTILDQNSSEINIETDSQDYYIDYYSGVVFRQDGDDSKVPAKIEAWVYIGEYASDIIESATNSSIFNQTGSFYATTNDIEITGSLKVTEGISGSFSGSFQGDGSELTGLVTNLNISASDNTSGALDLKTDDLIVSGTANEVEVNFNDATNTLQVGLPDDVIIAGDLTVNGTTTTINTENLLIEDRWALFASGSTSGVDGGIIVQSSINGGAPSGSAFGIDTSADRWALQKDFEDGTNTITPDAYLTTTEFDVSSNIPTNPTYGGETNGYGNIFVATDTEEIFIWA